MIKSEKEDLTRPTVEVKIPQVKLRLEDLAFLRSLANPDGIQCRVKESVKDRLRFLDLIHQANIPPSEKVVADVDYKKQQLLSQLREVIAREQWSEAANTVYKIQNELRRLTPTVADVLTKKGEELLANGEVKIRARKVGCV